MHRWLLKGFGACCAVMLTQSYAFADTSCPEGMQEFVNSETQERICIASDYLQTLDDSQSESNVVNESQDTSVIQNDSVESQSTDNVEEQPEYSEQTHDVEVAPVSAQNIELLQEYDSSAESAVKSQVQSNTKGKVIERSKLRSDVIHDNIMNPGLFFEAGLGYGFVANANIHLAAGYQFKSSDPVAAFALSLDLNIKPGVSPDFGMDITVDPTLYVSKNIFRFSLALGFGVFVTSDKNWLLDIDELDYNYDHDTDTYYSIYNKNGATGAFELKPRITFDFFLSTNSYVGVSLDMPMVVSKEFDKGIKAMVNLDIHVGCKF